MKKGLFKILTGVVAGYALRPFLERKAPMLRELCEEKMAEMNGHCGCHEKEPDEEPVAAGDVPEEDETN